MIDLDAIVDVIVERLAERIDLGTLPAGWMSTKEAAEYMGVSETWVRERLGQIPHSKVDGRLFFNSRDLDSWITNHRR